MMPDPTPLPARERYLRYLDRKEQFVRGMMFVLVFVCGLAAEDARQFSLTGRSWLNPITDLLIAFMTLGLVFVGFASLASIRRYRKGARSGETVKLVRRDE